MRRLLFTLSFLFLFTCAHAAIFKINIYKNPTCSGKLAGPAIVVDASKCSSYSYVDSKGVTTIGSQNNVRCYKDKVVFDKYPFSAKCLASESFYQGKQVTEKNHNLRVGVCQEAPSHDGPIYEKLVDYAYPGNEECKVKQKAP